MHTRCHVCQLLSRRCATCSCTCLSPKVRYEDLVADPKAIVQLLQRRFGLAPAVGQDAGSFANVESSTKTKQKDYAAYKEYYLKEKCVWSSKSRHAPAAHWREIDRERERETDREREINIKSESDASMAVSLVRVLRCS